MKSLKKYAAILIAIMMIISSFPMSAFAEELLTSGENDICTWSYNAETDTMYVNSVTLTGTDEGKLPLYDGDNTEIMFNGSFSRLIFNDKLSTINSLCLSRDKYPGLKTVIVNPQSPLAEIPDEMFLESDIEEFNLTPNIHYIGDFAFCYSRIKEFTFSSKIDHIGEFAFDSCYDLTNVSFAATSNAAGLELGAFAFAGCTSLEKINMKNVKLATNNLDGFTNRAIPEGCFESSVIQELILPEGVAIIGNNAFSYSSIQSMSLGKTSIICEQAFSHTQMPHLSLTSNVTTIKANAFEYGNFDKVTLNQACAVPSNAFNYARIGEINFGNTTSIGTNAFAHTRGFDSIDFSQTSVSTISTCAFEYSAVKELNFEGSRIEELGSSSFRFCEKLEYVNLGSIDTFGSNCFYGCSNAKFSQFGDFIFKIDSQAFSGTGIESVVLPDDCEMTAISSYCFYNCKNLTSVTLPDTITKIGNYAFQGCTALREITVPTALQTIGTGAFAECSSLEDFNFTACEQLQTINTSAFENCASLQGVINFYFNTLLNTIPKRCFAGCTSLEGVELTKNISTLLGDCFVDCSNIQRVLFENPYTVITNNPFNGSGSLKVIGYTASTAEAFAKNYGYAFETMGLVPSDEDGGLANPNDLRGTWDNGEWYYASTSNTFIITGSGAFTDTLKNGSGFPTSFHNVMETKKPSTIRFDEGITEIPASLTTFISRSYNLVLPSTLKKIEDNAFNGLPVISISFNGDVDDLHIGSYAFYNTNIQNLTLPGGSLTLGDYCFGNNLSLKTVEFGNGVSKIGDYCFYKCSYLNSVTLSDSIKEIGAYAFYQNVKLTAVTLPESLEKIDDGAFQYSCITQLNIPKNVKYIGKQSLMSSALKNIYAKCENADIFLDENEPANNAFGFSDSGVKYSGTTVYAVINSGFLEYCEKTGIKFVMDGSDATYEGYITNTATGEKYDASTSFKWYYYEKQNSFYISGAGTVNGRQFMNMDGTPFTERLSVDKLVILDGATTLGTAMAQINPKNVVLPNTLTEIYDTAFKDCNRLVSLNIPDSVTYLPNRPFVGCTSISSVTFGKGIKRIPVECFKGSKSLRYVDLGEATTIGEKAFMQCPNLEVINIPDTVVTIEEQAFYECLNVVSINLGTSVNKILDRAFANIPFCDKIVVSSDIFTIYARAFENTGISTSGIDVEYADNVVTANLHGLENINVSSVTVGESFNGFKEIVYIENLETIHISESCENYYVYKNCLYSKDNELVFVPHSMTTVDIKQGTTAIGDKAFMLSNINVVRIPDGVTRIGEKAFYNAKELKSVRFPETINTIGASAFEGCEKIKTAYIPYPCQTIEHDAFRNCTQLASVILPDGLNEIGLNCFNGCTSLVSMVVPESVETIASGAFAFIPGLKEVYIWNATVGYNCFKGSNNVTVKTLVGSPAHAFARTYGLQFSAYSDEEAFFDDCAAAMDILAGYLGYCTDGHGEIEWLSVYTGDCETDGYMIGVCEYCSQVLDEKHITAQGHKYSQVGYIEETATTAGIRVLKCTTCGEQYTSYTEPTGDNPVCEIHSVSGYITADTGKANSYGNTSLKSVNIVINGNVVARTNKQGYFSFNIKSGTYMAEIQYAYGFTRTVFIVVEDEDIVLNEAIKIVAVDFNSDKRIDDADVALFRVIVSSKEGDVSYLDYVDINHDGYINAKDYMIIQQFNGTSELTYTYPELIIKKSNTV